MASAGRDRGANSSVGTSFTSATGFGSEQMMGERPAAASTKRGQSPVNGGRGNPTVALANHAPVKEVFMPEQRWIKGAPPSTFPPGDRMGEVLADNLQCCRCTSLRVQEFEILLNRWMHALSLIAADRPSLLFYHSHTDSATCEHTA